MYHMTFYPERFPFPLPESLIPLKNVWGDAFRVLISQPQKRNYTPVVHGTSVAIGHGTYEIEFP